jgi:DNA mismatch endonuclease (patch repair protein)
VVVFCDGDFWHGRDWEQLRKALLRRHNADYWIAKIMSNRDRDRENMKRLTEQGWLVLRLWETDVLRDTRAAAVAVQLAVLSRLGEKPAQEPA